MWKDTKIGDVVVFCDENGQDHNALVTCTWFSGGGNCINLVRMSEDDNREDSYGRQIERHTSVSHGSVQDLHGFYWRLASEEKNSYTPPDHKQPA